MQEVLLAIMPPAEEEAQGPLGFAAISWLSGWSWGPTGVKAACPRWGASGGCRTQPSKLCTEMGPHVGPGKSPPRGPSERVRAVGLPSRILTSRLCAQMVFLAWAGSMNSASEKDFHNSYQTTVSLEGGH